MFQQVADVIAQKLTDTQNKHQKPKIWKIEKNCYPVHKYNQVRHCHLDSP